MNRHTSSIRLAALFAAAVAVSSCGGGGGASDPPGASSSSSISPAPVQVPVPTPPPPPPPPIQAITPTLPVPILSPNLAVFGDSLGRNMVASLQSLYPSLQIFNGGGSGESSTQITNRFMAYDDRGRITIIWSGHNSFRDPITVRTDIARIVANLGHQRYLVLGLVHEDQPSELPSGVDYPVKVALNEALATTYGPRFIDVREPIAAALNVGSAQDAADVRNGFTPSSLRVDGIHLNEAGSMIVARKVQERLRAWGW